MTRHGLRPCEYDYFAIATRATHTDPGNGIARRRKGDRVNPADRGPAKLAHHFAE